MSAEDAGDIFLCAVELATKMARSLGCSPAEIAKRQRSRAWILGQLKKKDFGVDEDFLRSLVEQLPKAKLSEAIPDLLPGERHRGVREESHEESKDPIWMFRAYKLAEVSRLPRSMFELSGLAKRLWNWPSSITENVVVVAEMHELINYTPPHWQRPENTEMQNEKPHRTRECMKQRSLPVTVPDFEQLKIVKARSGLLQQIHAIEEEQKQATAGFRSRIADVQRQLDRNESVIANGFELRSVECREVCDLDDGVLRVVRLDTGDLVEERALTEEESQLTLADQKPIAAIAGPASAEATT